MISEGLSGLYLHDLIHYFSLSSPIQSHWKPFYSSATLLYPYARVFELGGPLPRMLFSQI